jgi:hypothetical protein
VRLSPRHLAGVSEAEAELAELGAGYIIRYGDAAPRSDKFLSADPGAM